MNIKIDKRHIIFAILIIMFIVSMNMRMSGFNTPYLRNIDSFMHWRYIENIVDTGAIPPIDMLQLAPVGKDILPGLYFYHYMSAYSYMIVNPVFPMEVWEWLAWIPALMASLMIFPAYILGRELHSRKAGLFTAFFITFSTANVLRSLGGDADTDAIVMLLPIIVLAFFALAYKAIDIENWKSRKALIFSALTGVSLAIFANTWPGYWYVFWIILGFIIAKIIIDLALEKGIVKKALDLNKSIIINFITMFIVFSAIIIPTLGFGTITTTFTEPISLSGAFGSGEGSLKSEQGRISPNVYVSVQELMAGGNLGDIIDKTSNIRVRGSAFVIISPFLLSIFAFIYLIYSYVKRKQGLDILVFMTIWFIGAIYASMIAVRFTMFLIGVIALASGIFFAKFWDEALKERGEKSED